MWKLPNVHSCKCHLGFCQTYLKTILDVGNDSAFGVVANQRVSGVQCGVKKIRDACRKLWSENIGSVRGEEYSLSLFTVSQVGLIT